jgi:RND superfamily putative drug exporter
VIAQSLSYACARHAKVVLAAWGGALALSVITVIAFGEGAFTTAIERADGSESVRAEALLRERFAAAERAPLANETLIVQSDRYTVDDEAYRAQVRAMADRGFALGDESLSWGTSYYVTGDPALVSPDGRATLIPLALRNPREDMSRVEDAVRAAGLAEGFRVRAVGRGSIARDYRALGREDLAAELRYGVPAAIAVLLAVFGTAVAALVPLLVACASIGLALAVVVLAGQAAPAYFLVTNMIVMMGLALGIDYSLFVLSRYREERRSGRDALDAVRAAGGTASRTVLYSGVMVACALAGLMLVPTNVFRSLGAGAILVAGASVLASLTLLPALIGLLGDRLDALRIPLLGARAEPAAPGGFWDRVAAGVVRRPLVSLLASGALLLAAAMPAAHLNPGFAGVETLPERLASRQAYRLLREQFDYGVVSWTVIVVDGSPAAPQTQAAMRALRASLGADPAFLLRDAAQRQDAAGRTSVLTVPMDGDAEDPRVQDAVRRLRQHYIPAAFGDAPARALVAGNAAGYLDFFRLAADYAPLVLAFVLGMSFVMLTIAFRSIVVPLKAIALNLLSVGAAFGLLVLVFQQGAGARWLGLRQADTIEAWIPLFLFCVLFGLSMDYHVFLLSRIRERFERTRRNAESVAYGLRATGAIITGAALIMVAIFAGFASGELVMFQQAGFGLAVAVLLDATLVRAVMVPAAMTLLGERNWYLPAWRR